MGPTMAFGPTMVFHHGFESHHGFFTMGFGPIMGFQYPPWVFIMGFGLSMVLSWVFTMGFRSPSWLLVTPWLLGLSLAAGQGWLANCPRPANQNIIGHHQPPPQPVEDRHAPLWHAQSKQKTILPFCASIKAARFTQLNRRWIGALRDRHRWLQFILHTLEPTSGLKLKFCVPLRLLILCSQDVVNPWLGIEIFIFQQTSTLPFPSKQSVMDLTHIHHGPSQLCQRVNPASGSM